MRRARVSALSMVALLAVSALALAAPGAATAGPSSTSGSTTDARPDDEHNGTAFTAVADAGDGTVLAGGQRGLRDATATVARFDDGETVWTTTLDGNASTRVVDVAPDGNTVYALLLARTESPDRGVTLQLARLSDDGELLWRQTLSAADHRPSAARLVESDDGVAAAYGAPDGVTLTEYAGQTAVWERTYGVDARVASLEKTDDGYLLVGNARFGTPWALRTTESGRELLNVTYPGLETTGNLGGTLTDDGEVLLAGQDRLGFASASTSAVWAASTDEDGVVERTRVHEVGADFRVADVVATDGDLLLVGGNGPDADEATVNTVRIGDDAALAAEESTAGPQVVTAATLTGTELTVAGVDGFDAFNDTEFTGTVESVSAPGSTATGEATLEPDTALSSGLTVYRGQDVRVRDPGVTGETYELVRLPGERDDFDPQVVRRLELERNDPLVFESATLAAGEYVLRTTDGDPVAVEDGEVGAVTDREDATFRVASQRLFGVETDRTFVDVADGEDEVSISLDSRRETYEVYVTADRRVGANPTRADLRAAFGDEPGFVGVETVAGQPAARIAVDDESSIDASAGALEASLYGITVSGVDTRDGGAVASARLVVGTERERLLGLTLGSESLTVAPGEQTVTNVTLTNVTDGVSALSMSATLTGEPTVRLRLDGDINASRASGSAGFGRDKVTASTTQLRGQTPSGTVRVGTFGVEARSVGPGDISNGTNTATFRLDWIVDENGVPYSVPDERTVDVEVSERDPSPTNDSSSYEEWLEDVDNYNGTVVNRTGQSEVTVTVGADVNGDDLAFDPPAVRVDEGTTVVWEWSGEGGAHTVTAEDGTFDSGSPVAGDDETFEHTFDESGEYRYFCAPHRVLNMKGVVIVEDPEDGDSADSESADGSDDSDSADDTGESDSSDESYGRA